MSSLSRSVLTGRTPPRRCCDAGARDLRPGRRSSLLARDDGAWVVTAPRRRAAPPHPRRGTAGAASTTTHVLSCAADPLRAGRPAGARSLRRAGRAGPGVPSGCAPRESGPPTLEGAEATATGAAARGLPRPAHPLGDDARLGRRAARTRVCAEQDRTSLLCASTESADRLERLIDDLLDLSRVQTGLLPPALRPVQPEEVLPLAVSRPSARAVDARARRGRAPGASPTRACWSGSWPTWWQCASGPPRACRSGSSRGSAEDGSRSWSSIVDLASRPSTGADVRALPAARGLEPGGPRAGPGRARGLTEAIGGHPRGRRHPGRRPDHGADGAGGTRR